MTNRFKGRATSEIRRLAKVYIRMRVVSTVEEFQERFGWDADRLAHDLQWNSCYCCNRDCIARQFKPRSITVDIIDPQKPPDYITNAALLCPDCAGEKRYLSPEGWMLFRQSWAEFKERIRNRDTVEICRRCIALKSECICGRAFAHLVRVAAIIHHDMGQGA